MSEPATETKVTATPQATTATTTVKPGYLTTEFWLTTVAMLLSVLYASGVIGPDSTSSVGKAIALVAGALSTMGYTISRGTAKAK